MSYGMALGDDQFPDILSKRLNKWLKQMPCVQSHPAKLSAQRSKGLPRTEG
jgi:hypothetical protein